VPRLEFLRSRPITSGDLAQPTGLTTGVIIGVIDRLQKGGFARRAKNLGDRRRVVIEPFPERIESEIGPLFTSLVSAMDDLCVLYAPGSGQDYVGSSARKQ
jgi:hypothetical protein